MKKKKEEDFWSLGQQVMEKGRPKPVYKKIHQI
jgi:hypothetical protein